MSLQVQTLPKINDRPVNVVFNTPFSEPPVVILTPFWENSNGAVGGIPTVTSITNTGCTIVSNNHATADYFVNVLAIDMSTQKIDALMVAVGSVLKENVTVKVAYPNQFQSVNPVTLLTSFWNGSTGPVGNIDTLDQSSNKASTIVSNNKASNYFTNYVTIDLGSGNQGGTAFETGIVNKTGGGKQRVYFSQPFDVEPTVMLSPWWKDNNAQVGRIETVTKVTTDYFEYTSGNVASNYFVHWMAVLE